MRSNEAARLTLIGEAIDQLAAEATRAAGDPEGAASRIAAIWSMVAELDPGLAGRLRGYTDEEPGGRAIGTPGPGPS